jgi:uncharacterized membrane protein YedE/YeeE
MHISAFLIALAAVGVMGFANQRGSTCTVAALEEVVLKGTVKRLIALFEASLWAAAGLVLLNAAGLLASVPVNYAVGLGTILGGFLFGLGAFVNRACIFGTVARIGSGELQYLTSPCPPDSISAASQPCVFLVQRSWTADHRWSRRQHGSPF